MFTSIPKALQQILRETCQALLNTTKWAAGQEAPKKPRLCSLGCVTWAALTLLLCQSLLRYPASTQHCTRGALGFTRYTAIPIFWHSCPACRTITWQQHLWAVQLLQWAVRWAEHSTTMHLGSLYGGSSPACALSPPHLQSQRAKFHPTAMFIYSNLLKHGLSPLKHNCMNMQIVNPSQKVN